MMSKWCIWCETGKEQPDGYYWIHQDCADKLMDIDQDVERIKELLEKEKTGKSYPNDKIEAVYEYINRMKKHDERWKKTMELFEKLKEAERDE